MVNSRQYAFSLVELSIVLVILGLLVGGVLSGQSLIRAAEMRSGVTEYNRYISAALAFRDKYIALPGDMANATAFWGALDGPGGNGIGSDCRGESSGIPTCNGDGNGSLCRNATCASSTFESMLFWKHLANAGLIEGNYSGSSAGGTATICYSASDALLAGCNVPASKIRNAGWHTYDIGNSVSGPYLFDGNYGNTMQLLFLPTDIGGTLTGAITPEEAWNIDTKVDDGRPAIGNVVTSRWNTCTTGAASSADVSNAQYRLRNFGSTRCVMLFRNQF